MGEKENNKDKFYPHSYLTKTLTNYLYELLSAREKIVKPIGFFRKRYNMDAIIAISKEISDTKVNLWNAVYSEYPELKDKDAYVNSEGIYLRKQKNNN